MRKTLVAIVAGALLLASPASPQAQTPGVTKDEIHIGQTMPYSGNASAYGVVGKAMLAYFEKLNREQGGINGRKIKLTSLDDGYSPPKTVEQTRKLVEQDDVLLIFGTLGTPTNTAIHKYLNAKRIPHLFVTTGADKWADPKGFPWTMPGMVSYQTEAAVYGRYLRETRPDAKVALLMQNDDFGKDYAAGFRRGLGDAAKQMIVAEATYEVTDPTIDSQILALKASGADAFFSITLGKFSTQAISRAYEMGWRPRDFFVPTSSTSVKAILSPAGLEKSVGIITSSVTKSVSDPQWSEDPGMREYLAFLKQYLPASDPYDTSMVTGYNSAIILAQVLKQCGEDLSRENVLRQAANISNMSLPMLLPGIKVDTGPTDYLPYQTVRLQRFDGKSWNLFGDPISD
jgi:ABC-type branched-subunit amino acid transport system substrate-binding protein